MILADEINRTPPKTQAALLEAMQERSVSVGGHTLKLDQPFFVLATQNPIEQEGTYPLPEAQKDRFIFLVKVDYPEREEERQIIARTTGTFDTTLHAVITGAADPGAAAGGAEGPGAGARDGFRPRSGPLHAPEQSRRAGLCEGHHRVGRRPARLPEPGARRRRCARSCAAVST